MLTEHFEDSFLIPRRIANDTDYPASEANYLSVQEYVLYLENKIRDLKLELNPPF